MAPSPNTSTPPPPQGLRARAGAIWDNYFGLGARITSPMNYLFQAIVTSLRNGDLSRLWAARDEAFAKWYTDAGVNFIAFENTTAVPRVVAQAHGVVLEVGPGSGNQLQRFNLDNITHIFGVEPNTTFAGPFLERLKKIGEVNGLDKKYTPVFCGIEDGPALEAAGITEGSIDCVVVMQVLCSLPDAKGVARQLYRLLKPGGDLLFWEHTRNSHFVTRWVQWGWSSIWSLVVGGCRLDAPIKEILMQAGEWELLELELDETPMSLMPRLSGRLVKAKKTST
ncbi:S-adenosyl-L-methionine-dependent methyltransferase [Thozetella sp. PMI_491]|nr:S-adenosyl-L-methionine-dependent methyltransferase [Thozetella sp. PMI_491]